MKERTDNEVNCARLRNTHCAQATIRPKTMDTRNANTGPRENGGHLFRLLLAERTNVIDGPNDNGSCNAKLGTDSDSLTKKLTITIATAAKRNRIEFH